MTTLPYGTWPSIISAADLAAASPRFDGAAYAAGAIWWAEGVPAEGGRTAIFRSDRSGPVLPAPFNARSRVHEYGGGAWTVADDGTLFFVEATDQRVYRLDVDAAVPVPLTPEDASERFGNLSWQHARVVAVRERHVGTLVPARDIVTIDPENAAAAHSVVSGSDFLAEPHFNPDFTRLAWLAWNHPHMQWDASELRVGEIIGGVVPEWRVLSQTAATGLAWRGQELIFSDDPTGRWNLYASSGGNTRVLDAADADTGGAMWGLGSRWFTVLADGRIVAVRTNGTSSLAVLNPDGTSTPFACPLTSDITIAASNGSRVLVFGASATQPAGLWELDIDAGTTRAVRGGDIPWDAAWLPVPRAITVAGQLGNVHAFDYPPTHPDITGPADEHPPYVVLVHGGPTGHVSGGVSGAVAYFTSRGIGVLDVNYGGSTGYGRAYRERLNGMWGVADIDDVISAAQGLAAAGSADAARMAIKGGSAGGLTVLGALERDDTFRAGISRYGVADLRSLASDTHDFESRYLDGLIGTLPQDEAIYLDRSPLTHADRIQVPVLLLQGEDDLVVPPSQSEAIRDALVANRVPHKYVLFPGEAHGFRRAETITEAAELELAFLGAAFGFTPAATAPLTLD